MSRTYRDGTALAPAAGRPSSVVDLKARRGARAAVMTHVVAARGGSGVLRSHRAAIVRTWGCTSTRRSGGTPPPPLAASTPAWPSSCTAARHGTAVAAPPPLFALCRPGRRGHAAVWRGWRRPRRGAACPRRCRAPPTPPGEPPAPLCTHSRGRGATAARARHGGAARVSPRAGRRGRAADRADPDFVRAPRGASTRRQRLPGVDARTRRELMTRCPVGLPLVHARRTRDGPGA